MTSSRDRHPYADLVSADDELGLALASDMEAAYAASVPVLTFDPAARRMSQPTPLPRHWRPVAVGAIAAAILGAAILIPTTWGGETQTVSAEQILRNAQETLADPRGYHMVRRDTYLAGPNPNVPYPVTIHEVWYRDPSHMRFEIRDESGRVLRGFSRNGDEIWTYHNDGHDRAVHHHPDSPVGRLNWARAETQPSLLAVLDQLAQGCGSAPTLAGNGEILGRPAVLVESCGLQLVIDKQSAFVLKSGPVAPPPPSQDPSHVDLNDFQFETTAFEWDIEVAESDFAYEPPPGTTITEQDAEGQPRPR